MHDLMLAACLLQSSYPAEKAEGKDDGVVLSDYSSCGVTALYLACRTRDVAVEFGKLKELVGPPDAEGMHSFSDLSRAGRQLGLSPLPVEVNRMALASLPMPVIAQLNRSAYSDSLSHFVLVLKCEGDGVIVLDAPYPPRLVLDERFAQLWTGRVLAFARDEEEAEAIAGQSRVQ
jgi:ABC-type bacteriocin/lantibiotic exporter with double-glycine peptidase domain